MTSRSVLTQTPDWRALPAANWPWLQRLRQQARSDFLAQGLPGAGLEAWKYTRLGNLDEQRFEIGHGSIRQDSTAVASPCPSTTALQHSPLAGHLLVFQGGHWCAGRSRMLALPPGAKLMSLRQALEQERLFLQHQLGQIARHKGHPFAALNACWMDDGVLLYLPVDTVLSEPVHCRFEAPRDSESAACFPRLLIVLAAGAAAQVIEDHVGDSEPRAHLTNLVAEIRLAEGARLFHGRSVNEGAASQQFAGIHVEQAPGSFYQGFSLALGGSLCRTDLQVRLRGEGARTLLEGLYLLNGRQHLDNHLRVDHLAPGGRSEQFYKGILSGRARAVFNGLAVVHPDAQRSDARQINRNLLLSAGAEVDTKPELQIEADDVKCSHGATVGTLDEEALFYLTSRGLSTRMATGLLTLAFARETLLQLPTETLRNWFQAGMISALNAQLGGGQVIAGDGL